MREVALAYRRAGRAAKAEGASPPEYERQAVEAAVAVYRRHDPDSDRLEAARIALLMIANAINADCQLVLEWPRCLKVLKDVMTLLKEIMSIVYVIVYAITTCISYRICEY
jgi:hypothetical protein